ncbi:conserved protein of unknown function [Petrocella atlantisensis]|uniref:VWFA domain-containing protein n=1 Tax=Petrocella atlantisensis TaxID=2173034 RepID=A0A3P7PFY9_9FIRM|nr:vWA domain-containing protein [Petrocella atlantisensis]VDN48963.1 conserved protein of unknown function [Petrocella atlantisensis]
MKVTANIKKKIGFLMAFVWVLQMGMPIYANVNTTVTITKDTPEVTLSDAGERIFDIGYNFSVSYEQVTTGLDIVLVLDRSNSMLRIDPSTNKPVADAVWKAVNKFVNEVYATYPDSNMAIVSFGTNANKSDNWKYYNNKTETLNEIKSVFKYRDLYYNYNSNFSSYWNNGYRYAWEYWQISDGATNIKESFEYAENTVTKKQITGAPSEQDVIILFTDGVATQGGSTSQKNLNYPTSHNTNTTAAYQAGQSAQSVAEVIAVGYFEGIEYVATKNVARDTLVKSQNAGLFEASQTGQLSDIFDTIVGDLNYVGTNAKVIETIESEFEVVDGSIQPQNYTLTVDAQGRQVITWDLGNVVDTNYTFGYKVKVKDHVYPTGSGQVEIPINVNATLIYKDLSGNTITELLGQNVTAIPPRTNQPQVNVNVTYANNQFGYLVGDIIQMNHSLSYNNEAPFDYKTIYVKNLTKSTSDQNISEFITLQPASTGVGWGMINNKLSLNILESKSVVGSENLTWQKEVPLELKAIKEGSFRLDHNVEYQLTNSVGNVFDYTNLGLDPAAIDIKVGRLTFDFSDDFDTAITDVELYINGVLRPYTVEDGVIVVEGITSGLHKVSIPVPSGYLMTSQSGGISLDSDMNMVFDAVLSHATPQIDKVVTFERLKIKDIAVTTLDGSSEHNIDLLNEPTQSKISFELVRPLTKVEMTLFDDFADSNHTFVLNTYSGVADVRNASGNVVPGFTMTDGRLSYNGSQLPAGIYMAYGVLTPPSTLGHQLDYDFKVGINEIRTREQGDSTDLMSTITSKRLDVGVLDTVAPVIDVVVDPLESSVNLINHNITISDKTTIVTYKVFEGKLTYNQILAATNEQSIRVLSNLGNQVLLDSDMKVTLSTQLNKFVAKGAITIYAVDAFGNYSVKVVEYLNEELNDLLDQNIM